MVLEMHGGKKLTGERKRWRRAAPGDGDSAPASFDPIPSSSFALSPAGRFFEGFFGSAMRSFDYPLLKMAPNWNEEPVMRECNVGGTLGKVVDNDDEFALEVDASEFDANDLTVDLNENDRELVVEGSQENASGDDSTIARHFTRTFDVPSDIRVNGLASQLSLDGKLKITAPKSQPDEPVIIRRIPIRRVAENHANSGHDRENHVILSGQGSPPRLTCVEVETTPFEEHPYELKIFCIEPNHNESSFT